MLRDQARGLRRGQGARPHQAGDLTEAVAHGGGSTDPESLHPPQEAE